MDEHPADPTALSRAGDGVPLLRTEVTVGGRTWTISTLHTGVDSDTEAEVFETNIREPGAATARPVRTCLMRERAVQAHKVLVNEFVSSEEGAVAGR